MTIFVDAFTKADFDQVREIYQLGIDTNLATFQTKAKDYATWDADMLPHSRLVARCNGKVSGWAALSAVSSRDCYAGVCEVTIYIHPQYQGLGIGKRLLKALIESAEQHGIWTLQAGIFRANSASQRLHESCGFRLVGIREKLAMRNGQWMDIALMERRSKKVGID